jgi:hypothetical protein
MPHQCTNCGRTFPDGSKEMLSGCPECGGNKFQFKPSGTIELDDDGNVTDNSAPASPGSASSASDAPTTESEPAEPRTAGRNSRSTRDGSAAADDSPSASEDRPSKEWVGLDRDRDDTPSDGRTTAGDADDGDDDIIEADEVPVDSDANAEDRAQADARSATATPDEVAEAGAMPPDADSRVIEPQTDERPDISDLREELNDQFESIKILSPGQYELNLMELYDRQEYIISLQEDGRYVIEVPDAWHGDDES